MYSHLFNLFQGKSWKSNRFLLRDHRFNSIWYFMVDKGWVHIERQINSALPDVLLVFGTIQYCLLNTQILNHTLRVYTYSIREIVGKIQAIFRKKQEVFGKFYPLFCPFLRMSSIGKGAMEIQSWGSLRPKTSPSFPLGRLSSPISVVVHAQQGSCSFFASFKEAILWAYPLL